MAREKKSMVLAAVAVIVAVILLVFVFVKPVLSDNHRVLLVASDVLAQAGGQTKFESYLIKGIAVVPYNYDRVATYAELGDLIKAHVDSNGASRVRSVGIVYHTPNRYNLQCFASDPAKSTVSGSPESFESFRRFVVALRAACGVDDVDLVSCDVVSAERNVLASLDFNGARVNASTNTTGQVKQGPVGDWVLEAGNVNLIGRYFNATITQADLALATPAVAKRFCCACGEQVVIMLNNVQCCNNCRKPLPDARANKGCKVCCTASCYTASARSSSTPVGPDGKCSRCGKAYIAAAQWSTVAGKQVPGSCPTAAPAPKRP